MTAIGAIACAICVASALLALRSGAHAERHGPIVPIAVRLRAIIDGRRADAHAARTALPLLQSVHAALRSGLPLALALRLSVADLDPRGRAPFANALHAFDFGAPLDRSLRAAASAARERRVSLALEALALVADEQLAASRAAGVVASVADRIAFETRLLDEVRARTAGLRVQIIVLALLVPALAAYLSVTVPGLSATLMSPLGLRALIPGAFVFEAAGVVASRAIVRGLAS